MYVEQNKASMTKLKGQSSVTCSCIAWFGGQAFLFGTPSIRSGIVVEYMPIVKMLKMDLVNGDDTDFFHSAGHKATFLEKEAFSTFFLLHLSLEGDEWV